MLKKIKVSIKELKSMNFLMPTGNIKNTGLFNIGALMLFATGLAISINAHAASKVLPGNAPIETKGSLGAKPNILFTLDDSGSMGWNYLPNYVPSYDTTEVTNGDPRLRSAPKFNELYYNPEVVYPRPVDALGNQYPNQSIKATMSDVFVNPETTSNLLDIFEYEKTSTVLETAAGSTSMVCNVVFDRKSGNDEIKITCPNALPSSTDNKRPQGDLKISGATGTNSGYNGEYNILSYERDSNNKVAYIETSAISADKSLNSLTVSWSWPDKYETVVQTINAPYYYDISVKEYCSKDGVTCQATASKEAPVGFFVRWCKSTSDATSSEIPTGLDSTSVAKCRGTYSSTYNKLRRGALSLVEVPESQYTNFANWYAYHRTRILTMKTAVGLSFSRIGASQRVGFITINPNGGTTTTTSTVSLNCTTTFNRSSGNDEIYVKSCTGSMPSENSDVTKVKIISGAGGYNAVTYNVDSWYWRSSGAADFNLSSSPFGSTSTSNSVALELTVETSGTSISDAKFLPIQDFDAQQKKKFYSYLYSTTVNSGTPLREALSRAGRYFAGKNDLLNGNMLSNSTPTVNKVVQVVNLDGSITTSTQNVGALKSDPMNASCQRNYLLLSSDGYWNGNEGKRLDGTTSIGNQDGVVSLGYGIYDGGGSATGNSNSLADTALYYYKEDLRTGAAFPNNVPTTPTSNANHQHMSTYTISLGVDGELGFEAQYLEGASADYNAILAGKKDWTVPSKDTPSAIDDMWHAAVNGHGQYFSAKDPLSLAESLSNSINALIASVASSSAASVSSPILTQSDNYLFTATYRTAKWDGNIKAQLIDPITGEISSNVSWEAALLLNNKRSANSDDRKIYFGRKELVGGVETITRNDFIFKATPASTDLNATEKAYFKGKCTTGDLSQCTSLTEANKNLLNDGEKLVKYLRGQNGYEMSQNPSEPLFRSRDYILGDIVDTAPVYLSYSPYEWEDAGFSAHKITSKSMPPVLFVSANNGMIHAFDAKPNSSTVGQELWSYIPAQTLSKTWKVADSAYSTNHEFMINGPITVRDAYVKPVGATENSWRTVLVAALGQGGNGYVALDVTNRAEPKVLWEICTTAICSVVNSDLGLTYGAPMIAKRPTDNKWVVYVSTGYDNASGVGKVFELDLVSGALLRTFSTGSGTFDSPSGLAYFNIYFDGLFKNPKGKYMYAGDLNGDVWKWDLSDTGTTVNATKIGTAIGPSGNVQPISTQIELGFIKDNIVLMFGTGRYLNDSDVPLSGSTSAVQSFYAIKDSISGAASIRAQNGVIQKSASSFGANKIDWEDDKGWYMDFPANSERLNIAPRLVAGNLFFITNIPDVDSTSCKSGGSSVSYLVKILESSEVKATALSGGLVAGFSIIRLPTGDYKSIVNYVSGGSDGGAGIFKGKVVNQQKFRNSGWQNVIK